MPTEEKVLEQVNILSTKIIKTLLELNPDFDDSIEEMMGIAIFMFPKDHEKNGSVRCTLMGLICDKCLVKSLIHIESERGKERMPIA